MGKKNVGKEKNNDEEKRLCVCVSTQVCVFVLSANTHRLNQHYTMKTYALKKRILDGNMTGSYD